MSGQKAPSVPRGRWRCYVHRDWATDNNLLYVYISEPHSPVIHMATGITFRESDQSILGKDMEPLITVTRAEQQDNCDFLRAVFDACWQAGMRPEKFEDNSSEIASIRYHLEDMRKLVFK